VREERRRQITQARRALVPRSNGRWGEIAERLEFCDQRGGVGGDDHVHVVAAHGDRDGGGRERMGGDASLWPRGNAEHHDQQAGEAHRPAPRHRPARDHRRACVASRVARAMAAA
jgi:hypothetical protein